MIMIIMIIIVVIILRIVILPIKMIMIVRMIIPFGFRRSQAARATWEGRYL